MKVVIFCGGQGMRMREASESVPKPMIPIGYRPILWHVMKYYAHFGFTDFVLCLGYKAEAIKHFFLTYNEAMANDFVLSDGGAKVHLLKTDIHDWNITFVDTGLHACIGQRLRAVRHVLGDDEMFLANYGDTLTDADLPAMIERTKAADVTRELPRRAAQLQLPRRQHGRRRLRVDDVTDVTRSDVWINGGYFVMRSEILDDIGPGEDLVDEPFQRLMERKQLMAQRHHGFWAPMDTLKDKQSLELLHENGTAPWQVWDPSRRPRATWRSRPRADARASDEPPETAPLKAARRRRPLRRHRDRMRGHAPELVEQGLVSELWWVVLSGQNECRRAEAKASAEAMLEGDSASDHPAGLRRRLLPVRRAADQGVLRGASSATSRRTSSSRTSGTTCTRITASRAS